MKPELKQKIFNYNKRMKAQREKATDADILISALLTLPYGQLKKMLSDDMIAILEKYGYQK